MSPWQAECVFGLPRAIHARCLAENPPGRDFLEAEGEIIVPLHHDKYIVVVWVKTEYPLDRRPRVAIICNESGTPVLAAGSVACPLDTWAQVAASFAEFSTDRLWSVLGLLEGDAVPKTHSDEWDTILEVLEFEGPFWWVTQPTWEQTDIVQGHWPPDPPGGGQWPFSPPLGPFSAREAAEAAAHQ